MISDLAVVQTDAIGENARVDEFAVIREGATIGDNVIVHPHVVIESGVVIGDGVEVFPGSHIGKKPKGVGTTARPIAYEAKVLVGRDCAIGPNAVVFYDVVIGHNTLLGDGASLREQVRVGHHCLISRHVTVNYNSTIGDHTRVLDLTHITGNCTVGSNVFISTLVATVNDNVVIEREYDESKILGPQIEDGATVGAAAILLPGVRIGQGAFVASGAVVTKDVGPFDLVMGIPAKVVRNLRNSGH